jgi:hypothetical protein
LTRCLFISDLQIPFEHESALKFTKAVQKEFKIADEHVYNVGDEVDQLFGGRWPKDPDIPLSAVEEIAITRKKLQAWYRAFPQMKLATSNHGMRWAKKASAAEIPSEMMRTYQEVLQTPKGWVWKDKWVIKTARPIVMIHGMGYGGMYAYRTAAMDMGCNVVFGHLHANAGIAHVVTGNQECWGMNVGSLIDKASFAFAYGRDMRFKPWLGVGVAIDDGRTPILLPLERF